MTQSTYLNNRKHLSDDMPIFGSYHYTDAHIPNVKHDLRSALKYLSMKDRKLSEAQSAWDEMDVAGVAGSAIAETTEKEMAHIAFEVEALFNIDLEVLSGWLDECMNKVPSQHDMERMRIWETSHNVMAYAQAKQDWKKSYIEKIKTRRI